MIGEMRECKNCKHNCVRHDWFSYGEIFFCRFQMIWLISNIAELGEGNWPDSPDSSSYVDLPISKQFRDEAYFAKPVELVAEIMTRLRKAKQDGQTLMEEIHSGLREYYLLSGVAKTALNYISGWRRRRETYRSWKSRLKPSRGQG